MINFAYKDDSKKIILGVIVSDNPDDISKIVPKDLPYYTYTEGDDISSVFTNTPSGYGTVNKGN